jgi:hypothetical protein
MLAMRQRENCSLPCEVAVNPDRIFHALYYHKIVGHGYVVLKRRGAYGSAGKVYCFALPDQLFNNEREVTFPKLTESNEGYIAHKCRITVEVLGNKRSRPIRRKLGRPSIKRRERNS